MKFDVVLAVVSGTLMGVLVGLSTDAPLVMLLLLSGLGALFMYLFLAAPSPGRHRDRD